MKPKCERCKKEPGVVRFTDVSSRHIERRWLCRLCAAREGLLGSQADLEAARADVERLMSTVSHAAPEAPAAPPDLRCAACGLDTQAFTAAGALGCPGCYETFRPLLDPLFQRLHQNPRHVATEVEVPEGDLDSLRAALEEAVAAEAYERAARLRDAIRRLEHEAAEPPPEPPREDGP